jgi:hypothetical protein
MFQGCSLRIAAAADDQRLAKINKPQLLAMTAAKAQ